MADLQHDLDVDRAAAFSILMAHGRGISSKSPDYMMEKWRGIQECRNQMEVASFLDVFGQHIFYKWRDLWFKEDHSDSWPFDTIPSDSSDSSTANEGAKQEAAPTLRFIKCPEHSSAKESYCYVQDDGSHLKRHHCICGFYENPDCPIDLHRYYAGKGLTGESRLEI